MFQFENNGAPRFVLENTDSGVEWSFQHSGPRGVFDLLCDQAVRNVEDEFEIRQRIH